MEKQAMEFKKAFSKTSGHEFGYMVEPRSSHVILVRFPTEYVATKIRGEGFIPEGYVKRKMEIVSTVCETPIDVIAMKRLREANKISEEQMELWRSLPFYYVIQPK